MHLQLPFAMCVLPPDALPPEASPEASNLLHNLNNVLIIKHMLPANFLRLVLHTDAPHQCILELLHDAFVYPITEVLYCPSGLWKHNRIIVVWQLALQNKPVYTS